MTYTLRMNVVGSTSPTRVTANALIGASGPRGQIVVGVPASQLYFWSSAWQENEHLATAELAAGQGREFESSSAAIRWLLAEDE